VLRDHGHAAQGHAGPHERRQIPGRLVPAVLVQLDQLPQALVIRAEVHLPVACLQVPHLPVPVVAALDGLLVERAGQVPHGPIEHGRAGLLEEFGEVGLRCRR